MNVFISHNKKQKNAARLLAIALVDQGESVWFDEWTLRPGDSLTGGIEEGLTKATVFVLIWSKEAAKSKWVGTEVRAYLRRRVDNESLRIVPIMMDDAPLPTLLADYKGFSGRTTRSMAKIAAGIYGSPSATIIIRRLKKRLDELTFDADAKSDPLPYKRCPQCGEAHFTKSTSTDYARDEVYYIIVCKECGWSESTQ